MHNLACQVTRADLAVTAPPHAAQQLAGVTPQMCREQPSVCADAPVDVDPSGTLVSHTCISPPALYWQLCLRANPCRQADAAYTQCTPDHAHPSRHPADTRTEYALGELAWTSRRTPHLRDVALGPELRGLFRHSSHARGQVADDRPLAAPQGGLPGGCCCTHSVRLRRAQRCCQVCHVRLLALARRRHLI